MKRIPWLILAVLVGMLAGCASTAPSVIGGSAYGS
jgi:hypothetical protein